MGPPHLRSLLFLGPMQATVLTPSSSFHTEGRWHTERRMVPRITPSNGGQILESPDLYRISEKRECLDFRMALLWCSFIHSTYVSSASTSLLSTYYVDAASGAPTLGELWLFDGTAQKHSYRIPGLVLNPAGVEQGLSLLCASCIFFFLCQWGQLLSHKFRSKAFPDSRVTAFINYCISCFTYPNYLPTAQTMAFFKTFSFLTLSGKNRKYEYVWSPNLFQKTQHERHLLAKMRNINIDSHSLD